MDTHYTFAHNLQTGELIPAYEGAKLWTSITKYQNTGTEYICFRTAAAYFPYGQMGYDGKKVHYSSEMFDEAFAELTNHQRFLDVWVWLEKCNRGVDQHNWMIAADAFVRLYQADGVTLENTYFDHFMLVHVSEKIAPLYKLTWG